MIRRCCATVDCERPARWRSLTEGAAFGVTASLRCRQCCEAVDDAFDGLRRAVAAQNRKVTR